MTGVASLPMSGWPTGRKVTAGVFAAAGLAALACAAVYLSAVLFLVLNKANPRQAQFTSIARYWDLYADDAQLRKKLQIAIGVSGLGLVRALLPRRSSRFELQQQGARVAASLHLTPPGIVRVTDA